MGRTKNYAETSEAGYEFRERVARASKKKSKQKVTTSSKSAATQEATLDELMAQVRTRFTRIWRSLAHQFHKSTFGVFKASFTLKVAVIGLLAWVLFFKSDWIISESVKSTVLDFSAVETSISFSDDRGNKAIDWFDANSAAPVGANALHPEMADDYIKRFAPVAVSEMKKFGIPASISLAQGLVESRAGTSSLAKKNNNHFGIKCFSKKCRKGHCTNHTDDTHKDFFRKFPSAWESWRSHSQLLASGRYKDLKAYGRDYKKWARGLKEKGYATDSTYDEKLIGMIERFNLQRFDRE